jgi:DNA/RNA endonuclease YhcR with UshA esterase domain
VRRRHGQEHKTEPFPNNVYICRLTDEYKWAVPVSGEPTNIRGQTDEYRGSVKVKQDDPYIRRFPNSTGEYKVIFIGLKTDEYNLNIFISTDKFKTTDE